MWNFFALPGLFSIFFGLVFFGVIGIFLFIIIRGFSDWTRNNRQQVFSDPVRVMDKRTHVWGGTGNTGASTSYYITFEFENGDRQEFMVSSRVFSDTAAGDTGTLTWQGTRFHNFQRARL